MFPEKQLRTFGLESNKKSRTTTSKAVQRPITGCMLDLVNAFNHLPRLPIMKVGVKLGIPTPILHAWVSALMVMESRFFIRGATGPPLKSCSSLPEGCGMPVVGMFLINLIADKWLHLRVPKCSLLSYVDNLETTASIAQEVRRATQRV